MATNFHGGTPDALVIYDGGTNRRRTGLTTPTDPRNLAFNPLNDHIYCTVPGSNEITVVDGATDSVIGAIATPWHPEGFCFDPADNYLYCLTSIGALVIDCANDEIKDTLSVGFYWNAASYNPRSNRLYVTNSDSSMSVVDCSSNQIVARFPLGADAYAVTCDPMYNRAFVTTSRPSILVFRDSATGIEDSRAGRGPQKVAIIQSVVSGVLRLRLSDQRCQSLSVRIHDITGRVAMRAVIRPADARDQRVNLDVRSLPTGIYFLSAGTESGPGQRFVLIR